MKRFVLIAIAAVAALGVAAPAFAKEMSLLQVCGTNGCKSVKPAISLGHDGWRATGPPAIEDYYLMKVGIGDGVKIFERFDLYFVPSAGAFTGKDMAFGDGWSALPASAVARLRATAKGLKPFATPAPTRVYIEERESVDPAPYAKLLASLDATTVPDAPESPILIGLSWPRPNPWSSETLLNYLPKSKVLLRGNGYFRVADTLADRIGRERRGLAPVAPSPFPWAALAGGLAGAPLLAGAALVAYRRRKGGPAEPAAPA